MTTYSGPARLILADGAFVTGMASLSTNQRGGLDSWGGTFRPDQTGADLGNEGDGLQLEQPHDQIGTVAVTGARRLLATQVPISSTGRGPAPLLTVQAPTAGYRRRFRILSRRSWREGVYVSVREPIGG